LGNDEADGENDREPDPPHRHLVGMACRSLAERHDAHQHGDAHEPPGARISHDPRSG
jgi:hypothetical protein